MVQLCVLTLALFIPRNVPLARALPAVGACGSTNFLNFCSLRYELLKSITQYFGLFLSKCEGTARQPQHKQLSRVKNLPVRVRRRRDVWVWELPAHSR